MKWEITIKQEKKLKTITDHKDGETITHIKENEPADMFYLKRLKRDGYIYLGENNEFLEFYKNINTK